MPMHHPDLPDPRHANEQGGTIYGAGGAPVRAETRQGRDRVMIVAAGIGGLGVLIGVLFATGLTPFGPKDSHEASDTGAPTWMSGTSAPSPSAPTAEPTTAAPTTAPTTTTPPTTPPVAAPATGTLRSVASSLCLEVAPQAGVDGAPVQQVPCTGAPTQLWRLDRNGDVLRVVNTATGGCLDVAGASQDNAAPVHQWTCVDVPQQQWRAALSGNAFALASLSSGKCLDIPGGRGDHGLRTQQYDCNGAPAQQWVFAG